MKKQKTKYKIHHNKKLFWVIIFLLAVLIVLVIYIRKIEDKDKIIGGETDEHGCYLMAGYTWCEAKQKCLRTWEEPCIGQCTIDSDCVPEECCHPKNCVHKSNLPDCSGIVCTAVCEPGTLDCGQGECKCQENKCGAVVG